jgi:hypothetical protein
VADNRQMTFRPLWFIAEQEMVLSIPFIVVMTWPFLLPWLPVAVTLSSGVLVVWIVLAIRCGRTCVTVDEDGVTFSDIWRRGSIGWSEMLEIDTIRSRPFPPVQIQPFTVLRVTRRTHDRQPLYGSCLLSRRRRDELASALGRCAPHGRHVLALVKRDLTTAIQHRPH